MTAALTVSQPAGAADQACPAVSGPLDTWLPNLVSLRLLDLGINKLAGTIPPLSGITQLRSFSSDLNQLTGSLPSDCWALPNLRIFDVVSNELTGTIPEAIIPIPGVDRTLYPRVGLGGNLYASTCESCALLHTVCAR